MFHIPGAYGIIYNNKKKIVLWYILGTPLLREYFLMKSKCNQQFPSGILSIGTHHATF